MYTNIEWVVAEKALKLYKIVIIWKVVLWNPFIFPPPFKTVANPLSSFLSIGHSFHKSQEYDAFVSVKSKTGKNKDKSTPANIFIFTKYFTFISILFSHFALRLNLKDDYILSPLLNFFSSLFFVFFSFVILCFREFSFFLFVLFFLLITDDYSFF